MIKTWHIDHNSDHRDILTYGWLEITKVRIELNELEGNILAYNPETISCVESRRHLNNLQEMLDAVQDRIKTIDDIVITTEGENKDTEAWFIYNHHRWVECERIAKLNSRIEDISEGLINTPPTTKKRKILH